MYILQGVGNCPIKSLIISYILCSAVYFTQCNAHYFIPDEHLLLFIGQRTYTVGSSGPVIFVLANSNLRTNNFSVSHAECIPTLQFVNKRENYQKKTSTQQNKT